MMGKKCINITAKKLSANLSALPVPGPFLLLHTPSRLPETGYLMLGSKLASDTGTTLFAFLWGLVLANTR